MACLERAPVCVATNFYDLNFKIQATNTIRIQIGASKKIKLCIQPIHIHTKYGINMEVQEAQISFI